MTRRLLRHPKGAGAPYGGSPDSPAARAPARLLPSKLEMQAQALRTLMVIAALGVSGLG